MSWLARRILRPLCCFSSNGANTHRENSRARKRETTQSNTAKLIQPRPNWHGSPPAPINETCEKRTCLHEKRTRFLNLSYVGRGEVGDREEEGVSFIYSKPARLDKRLINSQGARCIVMHASISIQATRWLQRQCIRSYQFCRKTQFVEQYFIYALLIMTMHGLNDSFVGLCPQSKGLGYDCL